VISQKLMSNQIIQVLYKQGNILTKKIHKLNYLQQKNLHLDYPHKNKKIYFYHLKILKHRINLDLFKLFLHFNLLIDIEK